MRELSARSLTHSLCLLLIAALLLPMPPLRPAAAADLPPEPAPSMAPSAPPSCPAFNTARSARVDAPSLQLTLDAAPYYAHVGDAVTVTLTLRNDGQLPLAGVVVSMTAPAGLAAVRPSQGDYDHRSGRLALPLPRLEVSRTLTVTVTARVTGRAMQDGHVLLWAEARGGTLPGPVRDGALIVVGDPGREGRGQAEFPAAQGGRLTSTDGRVRVDFPPGALDAPGLARAEHAPWGLLRQERPAETLPGWWTAYHRVLPPFELTAEDDLGGPLRTFSRPVTITVAYDPAEVAALGLEEADLTLFWWDEDYVVTTTEGLTLTGLWVPLSSRVDVVSHTVTAATTHLTPFSLSDGSSPSDAFLPGVQAFQVSLFTGAGTASYPIRVPAGPGGLAPRLNLAYNSGAVDGKAGLRDKQQAGWVGRGWSLGLDYIAVVKNPSSVDINRNTYTIVLNGVSSDLVKHSATENGLPNPHYHVADEQFWAVWQEDVGSGTHYQSWCGTRCTWWGTPRTWCTPSTPSSGGTAR